MHYIHGFWTDDNGNKWDKTLFSEGQAEEESKTLKNCEECVNCRACENCEKCVNCENCYGCSKCQNVEGVAMRREMKGKHRRDYSGLGGEYEK